MNPIYDDLAKKAQKSVEAAKSDGIPDYLDLEPNTKKGCKVDVKGITLDSDVDGVLDSEDKEPIWLQPNVKCLLTSRIFSSKIISKCDEIF